MMINTSKWRKLEQAKSDEFKRKLMAGELEDQLKGSPLSSDDLIRWYKVKESLA